MKSKEVLDVIISNLIEIDPDMSNIQLNSDSKLSPLGLDSIGRAELIEMTLEKIGLQIPRRDIHTTSNIGELANYLSLQISKENE